MRLQQVQMKQPAFTGALLSFELFHIVFIEGQRGVDAGHCRATSCRYRRRSTIVFLVTND